MGLVQGSRLCQRPISIKSLPQDIIEEQGGGKRTTNKPAKEIENINIICRTPGVIVLVVSRMRRS